MGHFRYYYSMLYVSGVRRVYDISSANPLICSQGNCFPCEIGYNFAVYNMLYANASACATETAAMLSSFAGTATWETHSDPLAVGSFLWDVPGMAGFRLELKVRVAPARGDVVHVADAAACVELFKSAEVFDRAVRDINITDSCTQYDIRGPFVCTQVLHVHQPILQVLGSSIANSQMVVAVLAVLSGYIIKFVASRTQDKDAGCSISPVPKKPN